MSTVTIFFTIISGVILLLGIYLYVLFKSFNSMSCQEPSCCKKPLKHMDYCSNFNK